MHFPSSVLVVALVAGGATNALTTAWNRVETNARQIVPAFMAANPLFLKLQLTADLDRSQRRYFPKHCYRIPALCCGRENSDNFDAFQHEPTVQRRDFVTSAFCFLALLPTAVSATELAATSDVRDIDPELLRALVNVLRARGGVMFLLERLRTNKASWRICKNYSIKLNRTRVQ